MVGVGCYSWYLQDGLHTTFFYSSVLAISIGLVFHLPNRHVEFFPTTRQLYLLTACSWLLLILLSALPIYFGPVSTTIANAIFESASGITTTGSTIFVGIESLPHSLLLWRSVLQWIGGLGVIGMAVIVLPFLRIGGMRLFQAESSDWSDKSLPRFQDFAYAIGLFYLAITCFCVTAYFWAGMTWFDAVNHAMTTVSTGGYSTSDASMARFEAPVLWVGILFMLLSSLPFTIYVGLFVQRRWSALRDQQLVGFLIIVAMVVLVLSLERSLNTDQSLKQILTQVTFNVVSLITTTGYASANYTEWGTFTLVIVFFVTFIGGCSGSTSGGMKIFRFQLSWLFLKEQIYRLIHPNAVILLKYNRKVVSEDVMSAVIAFSFLFFITLALVSVMLALTGLDFVSSVTGALTALTNVGPGLGPLIGPAGNFATVSIAAKMILSMTMVLGRLELLTVMVLFTPVFWRA